MQVRKDDIVLTQFVGLLPHSTAKCFLAKDDQESLWVVRATNRFRMFCEYYVGQLAITAGVPRPRVFVVCIEKVKTQLDTSLELDFGVASPFIDNLNPIVPRASNRAEAIWYLKSKVSSGHYIADLLIYFVFSKWCFLDDVKCDSLHLTNSGDLVFLDFDVAFISSCAEQWAIPDPYTRNLDFVPPFLAGLEFTREQAEAALQQILFIPQCRIEQFAQLIGPRLGVPSDYIRQLITLLSNGREQFADALRSSAVFRHLRF